MSVMEAGIAERFFWMLVRELESNGKPCPVPLPMLRAFVQLGRQEVEIELRGQISELSAKIAQLERDALEVRLKQEADVAAARSKVEAYRELRRQVWESRRMGANHRENNPGARWRLSQTTLKAQRREIMRTLRSGLSFTEAARELGISVATLYRKIPRACRVRDRLVRKDLTVQAPML